MHEIFKCKRVGLVGGRPVDFRYMQRIEARAKSIEAACNAPQPKADQPTKQLNLFPVVRK